MRETSTPQSMRYYLEILGKADIRPLLSQVAAPVLVMHPAGPSHVEFDWASALVASLPDARLTLLSSGANSPVFGQGGREALAAIDDFLGHGAHPPRDQRLALDGVRPAREAALTARELDVLRLLAAGDSNKEIARALGVTVNTVERHVANLYRKIGARGRADATAYALHRNLA